MHFADQALVSLSCFGVALQQRGYRTFNMQVG
jgi:hypothetical protein